MNDKKVDIIDRIKIPKFGIQILSGLKIKKKNEIIGKILIKKDYEI